MSISTSEACQADPTETSVSGNADTGSPRPFANRRAKFIPEECDNPTIPAAADAAIPDSINSAICLVAVGFFTRLPTGRDRPAACVQRTPVVSLTPASAAALATDQPSSNLAQNVDLASSDALHPITQPLTNRCCIDH